jgi:hypothetical protein
MEDDVDRILLVLQQHAKSKRESVKALNTSRTVGCALQTPQLKTLGLQLGVLLVSCGEYSQHLAFYWSVVKYIPVISPSIG